MTPAQPPASEADVVDAVAIGMCRAHWSNDPRFDAYAPRYLPVAKAALTAARALGMLMPEEAAALIEERDAVAAEAEQAVFTLQDRAAENEALAARLKRAEAERDNAQASLEMLRLGIDAALAPRGEKVRWNGVIAMDNAGGGGGNG